MTIDAKKELIDFYERHFDELVDACLEVSSKKYRLSPLNTLPIDERRQWVRVGFREIIRFMVSGEADTEGEEVASYDERVYFPRVSELGDTPFFGVADIIDSCECALLPDEGILPLMWKDYADEPEKLLALVMEFRRAQNNMTKLQMAHQMRDYEKLIAFSRELAVSEERERLEGEIYQRFYLALRSLREKTGELYALANSEADRDLLATQVTQLKMMEADLLAEVFRIRPDADAERTIAVAEVPRRTFAEAARAAGLTERETEVVALVARGYGNKAIAERLSLAESTVKNNLSNILSKLGCENRAQIVVFAAENGYFEETNYNAMARETIA
ncbi:response regulator transcription factor [uncultured Adlercreutzia sp.]|uniref:response regulator transcription factor n=1 Tax=uncultured Adlercreutzia sp. TaxID=875803 RepID=UPI00266CD020|nr:helix-turn-helix transcriptional regulator [uncultured Adlercreutzia sp.]